MIVVLVKLGNKKNKAINIHILASIALLVGREDMSTQ
jgi:hypothetical protein